MFTAQQSDYLSVLIGAFILKENQRHSDLVVPRFLACWWKANCAWHQIHTLPHTNKRYERQSHFDKQWQQGTRQLHLQWWSTTTLYCSRLLWQGLSLFLADRKCSELSMTSGFQWNISIRPASGGNRKKKKFTILTSAIISVCPDTASLRSRSYHFILFRKLLKTWKHTRDGNETAQSSPFDICSLPCCIYLSYMPLANRTPWFWSKNWSLPIVLSLSNSTHFYSTIVGRVRL